MNGQGYDYGIQQLTEQITHQDIEQETQKLSRTEHAIREEILKIPTAELKQFIESQACLRLEEDRDEVPLSGYEKDDDEKFDPLAEGYDDSLDEDGDYSEMRVSVSPFEATTQTSDILKRAYIKPKNQNNYDVIIEESNVEESNGEWSVYTPAQVVITRCHFNEALNNIPKQVWLGNLMMKSMKERQKHLLQIGELFVTYIKHHPEFIISKERKKDLSCFFEFTQEQIARELDIDVTTVLRLKNAKFYITGVGEITLEEILDRTKKGLEFWVQRIVEGETPSNPLSDQDIAKKLPEPIRCTARQINNIRRALGIPGVRERKKAQKLAMGKK